MSVTSKLATICFKDILSCSLEVYFNCDNKHEAYRHLAVYLDIRLAECKLTTGQARIGPSQLRELQGSIILWQEAPKDDMEE